MNLQILEWTEDSIPALLELSQATLGTGGAVAKTPAFWRWKHSENPFGRSYGIYAEDAIAHRVAAMRILLRWRFLSPTGQTLLAARAVDTATHPDYQRRGLFSQLTRQAVTDLQRTGTQIIYNTPNAKSLPGYLKMGWTLVDKRTVYVRPLRPLRMAYRLLRDKTFPSLRNEAAHSRGPAVMPWHEFLDRYGDEVWRLLCEWERQRPRYGWRTDRSKAYYTWRYGQHPHVTYYVSVLADTQASGNLEGYCILRPNVRRGCQEIVLCELVASEATVRSVRRLVRNVMKNVHGDYVAAHFAAGSLESKAIRRMGFLPAAGQGMSFTVRPLCAPPSAVAHADVWDLTLGDLEIF